MLWTIAVILLILWLLGLVTSYTIGGFHPYFACDRKLWWCLIRVIQGRNSFSDGRS